MAEHTALLDAQRIQANGAILHTETRGSGPPVLLIAGAGGDAAGLAGRVDAAQPLGQFEGAFGLGAVYRERLGCQPTLPPSRPRLHWSPSATCRRVDRGLNGWCIVCATAGRSLAAKLERASGTRVRKQHRTADGFTGFATVAAMGHLLHYAGVRRPVQACELST
jgi:hypothetical protein